MELPILVRGHYKDTVARYDTETLFIITERYVKLYIFDCVEIVHDRAMAICVIALKRDVQVATESRLSLAVKSSFKQRNINHNNLKPSCLNCLFTYRSPVNIPAYNYGFMCRPYMACDHLWPK